MSKATLLLAEEKQNPYPDSPSPTTAVLQVLLAALIKLSPSQERNPILLTLSCYLLTQQVVESLNRSRWNIATG
jgi:hypothetical protein